MGGIQKTGYALDTGPDERRSTHKFFGTSDQDIDARNCFREIEHALASIHI
jgi:hypothetical protein